MQIIPAYCLIYSVRVNNPNEVSAWINIGHGLPIAQSNAKLSYVVSIRINPKHPAMVDFAKQNMKTLNSALELHRSVAKKVPGWNERDSIIWAGVIIESDDVAGFLALGSLIFSENDKHILESFKAQFPDINWSEKGV